MLFVELIDGGIIDASQFLLGLLFVFSNLLTQFSVIDDQLLIFTSLFLQINSYFGDLFLQCKCLIL